MAPGRPLLLLHRRVELGVDQVTLDELLSRAGAVSINCPLTPATRGLIGARELALLPPGAVLVNAARGPIVDEAALVDALTAGSLAGAGLDVFAGEPHVPAALLAHPRVVVTPHSADATHESLAAVTAACAARLLALEIA